MIRPKWAYALLSLLFLASCEEDLELVVPRAEPQLVVNSVFAKDSLWRIEVSTTAGDDGQLRMLKEATVKLHEDGQMISDLMLDSSLAAVGDLPVGARPDENRIIFYTRSIRSVPRAGKTYSVEVSYPGYKAVSASSTVPDNPFLTEVFSNSIDVVSIDGEFYQKFTFNIAEQLKQDRFYAVDLIAEDVAFGTRTRPVFYSTDRVLAEQLPYNPFREAGGLGRFNPAEGIYFTNEFFDGESRDFEIYVRQSLINRDVHLKLRVLALSKEFFDFAVTYQRQRFNRDKPFVEPTQVSSNVQDGLGVFGGYSVSQIKVR